MVSAVVSGKEKFVMMSLADETMFELPQSEVNLVHGESLNVSVSKNSKNYVSNTYNCIGDSGATEHVSHEQSNLVKMSERKLGQIRCANKNKSANLDIQGTG